VTSVLIVTNGRGEDTIGAAIAARLSRSTAVTAYPLVGLGEAYGGVPLVDPRRELPSGGFALRSGIRALLPDLRAGGLSFWRQQRAALRSRAGRDRVIVVIGDVYGLWMASHTRAPIVFVATAKSDFNERHRAYEITIIRRHAAAVFARDARTADALRRRRVDARFAGSPGVDVIPPPAGPLPVPPGAPVVLLLPGSRADALRNMIELLRLCRRVGETEPAVFVAALHPFLETVRVVRDAVAAGWAVDGAFLRSATAAVLLTRDFGSAVRLATTVVGLAGTASEQAAALAKPIVAFPPAGAVQYTAGFMRLQHRLLGDALLPTANWQQAAEATVRLLRSPDERIRRGAAGRERMGPPGAVPAIAAEAERRLR
jgi:uncharacterized protein (TIGR03492 family)